MIAPESSAPWRALRSLAGLTAGSAFAIGLGVGLGVAAAPLAAARVTAQQTTPPAPPPTSNTMARAAAPPPAGAKQAPSDTAHHFSGVIGVAIDSIHGAPLRAATVTVAGANRHGVTDSLGQFRIDSIVPGEYKLQLSHPLLDSIGVAIETQPIAMPLGRYAVVRMSTPSQSTVLNLFCPPDKRLTGPAAVIGRVLDADTDAPATGARVVLYWTELEVSAATGVHRAPRVREATVDSSGTYRVCGTPASVQGSLRASRAGLATADVPISNQGELVTIAMLHVPSPDTAVATSAPAPAGAAPAAAKPHTVALRTGRAVVEGRVTDPAGKPVVGAQLSVAGAEATTTTNDSGSYSLRGLPSGTQALQVRKLSFAPMQVTVDLSARAPHHTDLRLLPAPPTLTPVQVEGKREKGLRNVGFTQRQKSGLGRYLTSDQIAEKLPTVMTDIFSTVPGLTIDYSSGQPQLKGSRGAGGSCLTYVIDGVQTPMQGDFNDYMHPDEVAAVEVYQSSEAPAQFQTGGRSDCAVVVIWTKTRVGG
ncbi:MAG: carboxypeptidase regulatory-like domain-containing protein [Gemmatimonadales bacterium]